MEDYKVGSVAASVSGGKTCSEALSKLFSKAPDGFVVRYVPVKHHDERHEVMPKNPVRKSTRGPIDMGDQNIIPIKRKKKERNETSDIKKRKIEDVFDDIEKETKDFYKKKKKKCKLALNSSGDSDILATENVESRRKKKSQFLASETEPEIPDSKMKDGFKNFNLSKKNNKSKISVSESQVPLETIPKDKKRKKKKYITVSEETLVVNRNEEDTVSFPSETEEFNEDETRNDDSAEGEEEEEEEELTNKQCALKRLEKKRLKELKLQHVDEEQNARTVFVGNVPNDIKKKKLRKFFSKFGEVKTVRLRCAPLADPRVPKKVAIIKQKYHPERSNVHAFVCFEDIDSAHKALKANGSMIGEHHIRVDLVDNQPSNDQKKAVFIGNLPFAAEEDDLWKMFESCGEINNVRIIRDRVTGVGKGFAYINFETADAVELAVKLDGEEVKNRKLRVSRYAKKPVGKFVSKQTLHKHGFQKSARMESGSKERKNKAEIFKHKRTFENKARFSESGAQTRVVKKRMKASYQGQKIAEKKKLKKDKKLNRTEAKKKILVKKLGVSSKVQKGSKKQSFKASDS